MTKQQVNEVKQLSDVRRCSIQVMPDDKVSVFFQHGAKQTTIFTDREGLRAIVEAIDNMEPQFRPARRPKGEQPPSNIM